MQLILSEEQLSALDVVTLRGLCRGLRKANAGVKRELVTRLCGQPVVEQQPAGQTAVHSLLGSSMGSKRRRVSVDDQALHKSSHKSCTHKRAHGGCINSNHALLSPLSSSSPSSSSSLQPVRDRPGLLFSKDALPQRVAHGAAVELGGSQWQACVEIDGLVLSTASRTDDKKERVASRISNIKREVIDSNMK